MLGNTRSVRRQLNWINVLLVASALVGILGAWEIAKGARLHELNFLHIKYNHILADAVVDFERTGNTSASDLKEIVNRVRRQPVACLEVIGPFERVAMRAAGTYDAIVLCEKDVALANQIQAQIDAYNYGEISKAELCVALKAAVQGFSDNSAAFEPLVTHTVNLVFWSMMGLIILKGVLVVGIGVAVSRDVASNYAQLAGAQQESERLSAKLKRSRERFDRAVKGSEVGIWDYDIVGNDVYYSGKVWELLGYSLEDAQITRFDFEDRLHPDDRKKSLKALQAHLERGTPYDIQFRGRGKEGDYRWYRVKGQATWDDDGNPIRIAGSVSDIQELIESRQQAEEANKLKSEFLANMSHEIRTPMNGMLGMAQALKLTHLTSRQEEMVDVINQSGDALLNVIDDILDISKIEAGKLNIEVTEFDLSALVSSVEMLHRPKAEDKGLRFTVTADPGVEGTYQGDPTRIRQILNNLLSNAIKFTNEGSIDVTVTDEADDPARSELVFAVRDTGIGIDADQLSTLFNPFAQADSSTTRRFGGSGLGLAICKKLVRLMGGWIDAHSILDKGSVFRFGITLEKNQSAGDKSTKPKISDSPAIHSLPLRILAAEDNVQNQLVLTALLSSFGAHITVVANGQEVIDAWQSGTFDIVLMDIQMPGMDGVAATREIRQREKQQNRRPIPIIALTANAMTHQVEAYLEAGMNAHLAKPIQIEPLVKLLMRFAPDTAASSSPAPPRAAAS